MTTGYPKPLAMGPTCGKQLTANTTRLDRPDATIPGGAGTPSHPLRQGMRMGFDCPGQLHIPPTRHKCRDASCLAPPYFLSLQPGYCGRTRAGAHWSRCWLGEMGISTAKKQVLQSIAGAFSCNDVLHKWGIVRG
jgi:hypothetical protein